MRTFCPEGWLTKNSENKKTTLSPTTLAEAEATGEIMEGIVTMCDSNYNLIVQLGCMKGIIPKFEGAIGVTDGKTRDIALISRVGKPVCFVVNAIKVDGCGRLYAELSRRKAQERCMRYIKTNKGVGSVINARITHLESFGAFCDIGCGIIALLPIDSISVSRISHPRDRFDVGDDIRVVIKSIDEDGKITLSHKELLGTWMENAALFSAGQTVSGIIRSVEDYGVFVELTPNLAGLAEPKRDAFIGQKASVYIKSIIPEKMKVKLIIIDSFEGEHSKEFKYFTDAEKLTKWQYSPKDCPKLIVSVF